MDSLNIKAVIEIEPVVKIICVASHCKFNLGMHNNESYCNLKHITIGNDSRCMNFEDKNG